MCKEDINTNGESGVGYPMTVGHGNVGSAIAEYLGMEEKEPIIILPSNEDPFKPEPLQFKIQPLLPMVRFLDPIVENTFNEHKHNQTCAKNRKKRKKKKRSRK